MTDPIAYAALQVIPTVQGIAGQLDSQLTGPLVSAGRSAGQAAGRAVAQGIEQKRAEVEKASAALAAARDKEADTAGKVRVAEAKLQELRDRGNASASQLARAEEALATAERNANRATQARERAVQGLTDARARLANHTDEAVQSESRFANALSGMTSRLGPAAKQLAAVSAATAGIGSAMEIASQAMETEQLNDKLAAQLGAGPEMAAEFGGIAGRLYANAYGENLGEVNEALKNVWQQGLLDEDATSGEIESVTASVLDLAGAFDQDVSGAAAAVGTILKTGLAPDAQSAMDILTRGFQQGADKSGDLLDTFIEYPALFQALGLSAADATGILSQGLSAGAFNADKVADALKEFQIRATDGSESSKAAYEALGLSAEQMTAQIAAGGAGAREGLDTVLDRLRAMEDPVQRNAAAVGLFGTQAEDLAGALFALDPSEAVAGLGEVDGAATRLGETLADNTSTSLEKLKRGLQTELVAALTDSAHWIDQNRTTAMILAGAVGTLGAALVTAKVAAMGYAVAQGTMAAAQGAGTAALAGNTLALGAYTVATGVIRGATLAWSAVQWVLNAALSANPIGLVVVAIAALVAGIVLAYNKSETFRAIVQGLWDGIKTGASFVWDNVLKPFFSWWSDNFQKAGEIASGLATKAGEAKDWIVDHFTSLISFVVGMPGKIRSAAAGLWDGITDTFRSAINWVISRWNSFRLGFDFTIPVIDKHVSFTIDTPDLPLLAGGGIAGRTAAGLLWGPGTGTSDSILGVDANGIPTARVSTGEGVVTEDAMRNGGAQLVAALNAGWTPPAEWLNNMVRGGARLAHGRYDGSLRGIGLEEDNPLVAAVLGLRSLLHDGDVTGNLSSLGVEEDNPAVSAALGLRSLLLGDYDGSLRGIGLEEDNPLVDLGLGVGGLLRGDYRGNLRALGVEEDSPLVDAGLGLGGLLRGDYTGNLSNLGLEEDHPLVAAALDARRFLAGVPGFADGGLVDTQSWVRGEAGKPYQYAGTGNPSWDCSAIQGGIWAKLNGKNPNARYFTTESDFSQFGFLPGPGGPGDFTIGVMRGGGGPNSHMSGRLGDLKVESSGSDGVEVGSGAKDPSEFPLQWHFPIPGNPLTEGSPGTLGGLGGGVGSSPGGFSGGSPGSSSSSPSGVTGSGTRPPGTAVPVWVDNMPASFGAAPGSATGPGVVPGVGGAPSEPAAPGVGGTGVDQHYGAGHPAEGQQSDPWAEWAKGAADGFGKYLEGNWKEMLNSALAVAGIGAGMSGGGNTYNLIGPDPRQAAMAVERLHRRQIAAARRIGGFGR
ncbi:phage tail tape measure protein [Nocardia asiatica]|uniref:phage tail tape measure protein n=1 Tax=Nocardia asiatica TaxID=209252 RepID=UPI002456A13D|nr:phage tail tape measure protein [Nocardia asiatica]